MRRGLADVRSGRTEKLTGGDNLPEDLRPLVDEINGLIDQNTKLVERARTHVGNLAHALKTPLSIIQNSVEALDDETSELVSAQTRRIRVHVDHHLKRARIAGGGTGPGLPAKERIDKLAHAISVISKEKDLDITVVCDPSLLFDGEKEDFDEIIGNVLENAGKWAVKQVSVSVKRVVEGLRRPMLEVFVEDDGPGVPGQVQLTAGKMGGLGVRMYLPAK